MGPAEGGGIVSHEPPVELRRRFCTECGRTAADRYGLADAHNPAWPDASPIVCTGPVLDLVYGLVAADETKDTA